MISVIIRSVVFNIVFFFSMGVLFILNSPALLLKNPPFYFSKFTCSYSLWLLKKVCGLDYKIEGFEHVPEGPCIFASKHQSAWDTIVFQALFPDAVYVLKKELLAIPIYGQFIKKFGMIVIDRKRGIKALSDLRNQARSIIQQDRKIVIFPEGSRTAPGQAGKYQKGIYALYKDFSCPIIPVTLNSGVYWGRRSWLKYPGCITLKFLPTIPKGLKDEAFMQQLASSIEEAAL